MNIKGTKINGRHNLRTIIKVIFVIFLLLVLPCYQLAITYCTHEKLSSRLLLGELVCSGQDMLYPGAQNNFSITQPLNLKTHNI